MGLEKDYQSIVTIKTYFANNNLQLLGALSYYYIK